MQIQHEQQTDTCTWQIESWVIGFFWNIQSYLLRIGAVECPRGAFSISIEVVIRNIETGAETLCRVWSDGFTIIAPESEMNGIFDSIDAPAEEEYVSKKHFV